MLYKCYILMQITFHSVSHYELCYHSLSDSIHCDETHYKIFHMMMLIIVYNNTLLVIINSIDAVRDFLVSIVFIFTVLYGR